MNVRIDVSSPGGHSSVPPSHTVRSLPLSYFGNALPDNFYLEYRYARSCVSGIRKQPIPGPLRTSSFHFVVLDLTSYATS